MKASLGRDRIGCLVQRGRGHRSPSIRACTAGLLKFVHLMADNTTSSGAIRSQSYMRVNPSRLWLRLSASSRARQLRSSASAYEYPACHSRNEKRTIMTTNAIRLFLCCARACACASSCVTPGGNCVVAACIGPPAPSVG